MAYPDPLEITANAIEHTFVGTKVLPDGRVRMDSTTGLSTPRLLVIKHQQSGSAKQNNLTDRHLIQLSRAERDPDTGIIHTGQVNLTVVVPRVDLFTQSEVAHEILILQSLLTDPDTVPRLLRGES